MTNSSSLTAQAELFQFFVLAPLLIPLMPPKLLLGTKSTIPTIGPSAAPRNKKIPPADAGGNASCQGELSAVGSGDGLFRHRPADVDAIIGNPPSPTQRFMPASPL
jgi:hypothetical protein